MDGAEFRLRTPEHTPGGDAALPHARPLCDRHRANHSLGLRHQPVPPPPQGTREGRRRVHLLCTASAAPSAGIAASSSASGLLVAGRARGCRGHARRPLRRLVLDPGHRVAGGPGPAGRPLRPDRGHGQILFEVKHGQDHRLGERDGRGRARQRRSTRSRGHAQQPADRRRPRRSTRTTAATLGSLRFADRSRRTTTLDDVQEAGTPPAGSPVTHLGRRRCLQEHAPTRARSPSSSGCSSRS